MRCSTTAGVPGEVEEHQPAAELEVPPLAAGLGGDQDRRPLGEPELRHLDVSPLGRELLVEDAGRRPWRSIAALSRSSVSRCATKTSVFSSGPTSGRPARPASATRGSCRVRLVPPGPRSRSPPGRGLEQGGGGGERRGRPAPPCAAARAAFSAGCARRCRTSRSSASHPASSISTGAGTRGGRPPMSARRVALVQGGSGSRRARRSSKDSSSGNSSGRRSWSRRKKPWASSSSGRRGEQEDVLAQAPRSAPRRGRPRCRDAPWRRR